jgi:hypothetical protein
MYGRLNAIKSGRCKLTLVSLVNSNAKDYRNILVLNKRNDTDKVPQRIIKFSGQPAKVVKNLQKIVTRYTK